MALLLYLSVAPPLPVPAPQACPPVPAPVM